ncbi:hypothetical protein QBC46DRAFT_453023 [Diplogelasinospora grovesii]|uniref:Uncharacterized protein n=1 Tax=Diplogelasinospora grovesii TaxID=303347 RepID=A0AAN6MZ63_9PEZI|nr:hypothetical protein QBC46DRAFT_453023 [Diplogelasinospora grovesii]
MAIIISIAPVLPSPGQTIAVPTQSGKRQLRRRLLLAAFALNLLSIVFLLVVNPAGYQVNTQSILAPDAYILTWTQWYNISTSDTPQGGTVERPFTVYYYLNAVCITTTTATTRCLYKSAGRDLDYPAIGAAVTDYLNFASIQGQDGSFQVVKHSSGEGTGVLLPLLSNTSPPPPTPAPAPPSSGGPQQFGKAMFVGGRGGDILAAAASYTRLCRPHPTTPPGTAQTQVQVQIHHKGGVNFVYVRSSGL